MIHPSCAGPPLVALGVDGVLDPHPSRYRRRAAEAGLPPYMTFTVQIPQPRGEEPIPWEVRLNPDHAAWLRRLQGDGLELILQPTFPDTAELIRTEFDVDFRVASIDAFGGEVPHLSNARPLLWIVSHELVESIRIAYIRHVAADRNGFGWPTMLIETDRYVGLTPAEMAVADGWLAEIRSHLPEEVS